MAVGLWFRAVELGYLTENCDKLKKNSQILLDMPTLYMQGIKYFDFFKKE